MDFKVGDKVRLQPCWNFFQAEDDHLIPIHTIISITTNYVYNSYMGEQIVTKINLDEENGIWAEPHEIKLLSKLERALK